MSLVFKFKPLGYFQTSVVLVEPRSLVRLSCLHLVYGPHEGAIERTRPWESLVAQIATGPWCLLKVRLCSPLQLVTLLYRCVFRLLPTPSSSTSQNPSCTNLFGKLLCTYFYDIFSDTDYVQNPTKKYICLRKLLGVLREGVGWGFGTCSLDKATLWLSENKKTNMRYGFSLSYSILTRDYLHVPFSKSSSLHRK